MSRRIRYLLLLYSPLLLKQSLSLSLSLSLSPSLSSLSLPSLSLPSLVLLSPYHCKISDWKYRNKDQSARSMTTTTAEAMMNSAIDNNNNNNDNNDNNNNNDLIILDKTIFNKTITLIALNVPSKLCSIYLSTFAKYTLSLPKTKRIIHIDGNNERRLVLLSDTLSSSLLSLSNNNLDNVYEHLPQDLKSYNKEQGATVELYSFDIGYDNLAVDEVLRKLLPEDIKEIPSSFEQAGHLAHINLRDEVLPYKHIIGQVIIDKNPCIKTVINKVGTIETEFRTFPIELLAGENNFYVTLRESNAKFQFDFDKVYWNSRLQMEHSRLINLIKSSCKNEELDMETKKKNKNGTSSTTPRDRVVADMMAGIGPFAIPLAKERVKVYANDLNPASFQCLVSNIKLNHCENFTEPYNLDGRKFILQLIEKGIHFNEVIMNLPQSATEFLDVFIGLGTRIGPKFDESLLPRIHVYAFSTADDPIADIVERVAGVLRCDKSILNFKGSSDIPKKMEESLSHPCWGHIVRDVAPKKLMICLSFTLPLEVAMQPFDEEIEENAKKKTRIN